MFQHVLGVLALAFGVLTLVVRFTAPDSALFSKLAAMKQSMGDTAGTIVHVTAYTALPMIVGIALIAAWAMGVTPPI